MATNAMRRIRVHEALKASHGDEVATSLMEMLPPVEWADVATKQDLALLKHDVVALKHDVAALEARLDERMDLRFRVVDEQFATTRHELREHFEREMRRQTTRFVAFMLTGLAAFNLAGRLI